MKVMVKAGLTEMMTFVCFVGTLQRQQTAITAQSLTNGLHSNEQTDLELE